MRQRVEQREGAAVAQQQPEIVPAVEVSPRHVLMHYVVRRPRVAARARRSSPRDPNQGSEPRQRGGTTELVCLT